MEKAYLLAIRESTACGADAQAGELSAKLVAMRKEIAPIVPYQSAREAENDRPKVANAKAQPPIDPTILVESRWNFTRRADGINQSGAFKIVDSIIYHLDTSNPVGLAEVDPAGRIHLVFNGHRKIAEGEALVSRVAPGQFRGSLIFLGGEHKFELSRR